MRWKYVIPALVIIILLVVFNLFFMDTLLRHGLIAGGQFTFGARVEVASVKTRLSNLSLSIHGLAVADKNAPMKNLFSVETLAFSVDPLPLLSKKAIINEMTLTGLQYGTQRKTSGALPPRRQAKIKKSWLSADSAAGRLAGQVSARAVSQAQALPAFQAIQAAKEQLKTTNVQGLLKPENVPMLKDLSAMKTGYQQKASDYQAQLNQLKIQEALASVGPAFNEVAALKINNPQDALAAKDKIARLNQRVQDLQTLSRRVADLASQAETDFGTPQALRRRIDELKNRDLQTLGTLFHLPTFDFSNLTGLILGPVWMQRLSLTLDWLAKARTIMPAAKTKDKKSAPVTQPRLHGLDVRFPVANRPPRFWIKRITLSGTTGGAGKTNLPVDFSGSLTDLTSDPRLVGRPLRLDVSGAQGNRRIGVLAILDHTQEIPTDQLKIDIAGLRAEELQLPKSDYLPAFQGGNARIAAGVTLTGDQLAASLRLDLTALSSVPTSAPATRDSAAQIAAALWAGIDSLNFEAQATGSPERLNFSMNSNLDQRLAERLQKILGQEIAGVQTKLRAELDKLIAGEQSALLSAFGAEQKNVFGSLASEQKALTDKIAAIQALIREKQTAGTGNLTQPADAIKNKAQDQLKGLFGQ